MTYSAVKTDKNRYGFCVNRLCLFCISVSEKVIFFFYDAYNLKKERGDNMLTVLEIERNNNKTFMQKIASLFHPYDISTTIKKHNKISVLCIKYRLNRGKIRYKKIYDYAICAPKTVICSNELELENTPFSRFESDEYARIMMQNAVCDILGRAAVSPNSLRIAYYDPMADAPLFTEKLSEFTSQLMVITNMPRFYEKESERLSESIGASFTVNNSPERLSDCDILICPKRIDTKLPVSEKTIIFTSSKPAVSLKGTVIYEFFPEFPYKYQRLKPESIDGVYFLSALYSLGGAKELAKLVPAACGDGQILYTAERLAQRIRNTSEEINSVISYNELNAEKRSV